MMKHLFLLLFFATFYGANSINAQTANQIKPTAPAAVSHKPDINDPDYAAKKLEWVTKYPAEYEREIALETERNKVKSPTIVTKAEFNKLTEEERTRMLSRPDLYQVK